MFEKSRTLSVALFSVCLGFISVFASANESGGVAHVTSVSGTVLIRHQAGISAKEFRARTNSEIFNGDSIATGADGEAKILFTDNSIIDVSENSLFKVEHFAQRSIEGRSALIKLLQGKLRLLISKVLGSSNNFNVETKDTKLGVRGTEFVVNVGSLQNPVPTEVTVFTGLVAVSFPETKQPEIVLQSSMQFVASQHPEMTPAVASLSSAQIQSIRGNAVVENRSFNHEVIVSGDRQASSGAGDGQATSGVTMVMNATEAVLADVNAKAADLAPSGQDNEQNLNLSDVLANSTPDLLPGNYVQVEVLLK